MFQLEHIGPDRGELFFYFTDRCHVSLAGNFRLGQGAFVELAVGGQRQTLKQYEVGGHHVVRQARLQLAQQLSCRARGGYHIGEQLQAIRVALQRHRHDHRVLHAGQATQQLADLAGLDPIATDLHLLIGAAKKLHLALLQTGAVASTVQARALAGWVGDKSLGSHRRPAQVTLGHTLAAQIQLTGNPLGNRVKRRIEQAHMAVGQGLADRHGARTGLKLGDLVAENADGGFGRAIVVDQPAVGPELSDLFHQ